MKIQKPRFLTTEKMSQRQSEIMNAVCYAYKKRPQNDTINELYLDRHTLKKFTNTSNIESEFPGLPEVDFVASGKFDYTVTLSGRFTYDMRKNFYTIDHRVYKALPHSARIVYELIRCSRFGTKWATIRDWCDTLGIEADRRDLLIRLGRAVSLINEQVGDEYELLKQGYPTSEIRIKKNGETIRCIACKSPTSKKDAVCASCLKIFKIVWKHRMDRQ
jgi:hypothetical protein